MAPCKPKGQAKEEPKKSADATVKAIGMKSKAEDEKNKAEIKSKAEVDSHKKHEKQPQPRWK